MTATGPSPDTTAEHARLAGVIGRAEEDLFEFSSARSGDDLLGGFLVELDGWNWHMFRIDPIIRDVPDGSSR